MKRIITSYLILVVLVLFSSQSFAAVPGTPGTPSASSITGTSFNVSWSASSNSPTHYYVDVSTSSTFASFVYTALDAVLVCTNYAITGLSNATTYYVRVRAYNASGYSLSYSGTSSAITTLPLAPAAPVAAAATSISTTGFTANWAASTGATGYWLDVGTTSGGTQVLNNSSVGNVLTKAVTGLTPGVTYYYLVRASNTGGTSVNSNIITAPTIPGVPTALAASGFTATTFTANWNAVTGATGYLLDVGTTSGGTDIVNNANVGNVTSYIVSGTPGIKYYYRVRAYNGSGTNTTSSSIITASMVPAAPALNGRTTATASSVIVTWTAPTGNVSITGYYIDVATDSGFTNMLINNVLTSTLTPATATSCTVTGVTPGTDYYYQVRAYNASGTSGNSSSKYIDFTAPTLVGITAGTSSTDPNPVNLTVGTLGGPYITTTTPFLTVNFSEPVLGVQYNTNAQGIVLKNSGGTIQTITTYTPTNNTTATPAGNPSSATFQAPALANTSCTTSKYSVTISGGLTATTIHDAGSATPTYDNALTSAGPYYFTVETTAPTIGSVTPANGATSVPVNQVITVVFTENCYMDYRTFTSLNVQLTDSDGNLVTTTLSWSASPYYTTLTITPPPFGLEYNTTYTLTLNNIKNAAGYLLGGTGSLPLSLSPFNFTTQRMSSSSYSIVPSFLSAPVTPNVLIILDNSNSMDETLTTGDGIGSFNCTDSNDLNSCSRSVLARQALINLINTYAGKINIGLMSYFLPNNTSKSWYVYNNFYFVSYDPHTYCGIIPPPQSCYNYCVNEEPKAGIAYKDYTPTQYEADCDSACQTGQTTDHGDGTPIIYYNGTYNTDFQANIRDPITTFVGIGGVTGSTQNSKKRDTYCSLIYPKTVAYAYTDNATPANTGTLYHSVPGTFYSQSSAEGKRFPHAESPQGTPNYTPAESHTTSSNYYIYEDKATPNVPPYDVGYSVPATNYSFGGTDDDLAMGFQNYGQANMYYPPYNGNASPTWSSSTYTVSPQSNTGGFLHVPVAINNDAPTNTQLNKLLNKLGANGFKNDATGYMACTSSGSSANRCSYIVNAGATPTAATLQSAIDYLNGSLDAGKTQANASPSSPIQYSCQKTFIIYVTDGLPSVDDGTGAVIDATSLVTGYDSGGNSVTVPGGTVLGKLNMLRYPDPDNLTCKTCGVHLLINSTDTPFDIQTYVLGLSISPQSSTLLDKMAQAGGTAVNGKAYYANDAASLSNAMNGIFENIFTKLSAGTAASILNNSEGSGANLMQAVFYPNKSFAADPTTKVTSQCNWIGEMQNLWYYLDPNLQNTSIREDSDQNNILNLKLDKIARFYFDASQTKTSVDLYSDANGDGLADSTTPDKTIDPDYVRSLWKAGMSLWNRDVSASGDPRTIYTGYNSSTGATPQLLTMSVFNNTASLDLLQIPAALTLTQRQAKATTLLNWVYGMDQTNDSDGTAYRSRKVTINVCSNNHQIYCKIDSDCTSINGTAGTCGAITSDWKLGDIISSTPKLVSNIHLNSYSLSPPTGYNDMSYNSFINTPTYKNRGMAFVGGNDGMLHAFKLGIVQELTGKYDKAQINNASGALAGAGDNLGREEWAYIPKDVLPYLTYLTDPSYRHLYFVDRTVSIVDADIGVPAGGCLGDYSTCTSQCNATDSTQPCTWRTVLIGGMGIGGAVKSWSDSCTAPANCVKPPISDAGLSSYFALDVTDPEAPKYLWEFNGDPLNSKYLGYTTTGPAIVREAKKFADGTPDNTKNGKWFAVFASGPTGPIDTTLQAFMGQSDQTLKIFIVDLATGTLLRTIDTGIANAFAGSLSSSVIDADKATPTSKGFYSDDAVYIGYVQKDTTVTPNTWTKGGVIRLTTMESDDPASSDTTKQWSWSTLISGTGPVTSSITKLQDRTNNTLWIYFGTGRYFFKSDDPSTTTTQRLYGLKEPCYSTPTGIVNTIDKTCTASVVTTEQSTCKSTMFPDSITGLCNQSGNASNSPAAKLDSTMSGWFINLDAADSTYLSERVITDPVASPAGAVFFTTFKPSAYICAFGGNSLLWAINYSTGAAAPAVAMQGKALMQVSTGAFAEITLNTAFISPTGNKREDGRKLASPITGVPPTAQGLSLISNPPPAKKVLHIREK